MINIDLLKQAFDYRINHAQQGTYTIDQFNHIAYLASLMLHNKYIGIEEQYMPQIKGTVVQYANTKKIHTAMLPFKEYIDIPLIENSDFIGIPNDMSYLLNIRSIYYAQKDDVKYKTQLSNCGCTQFGEATKNNIVYKKYIKDIKFTPEDKWANRTESKILKSDSYCPFSDKIELNFKRLRPNKIRLEYIKKVKQPKWAYILLGGVPVYDHINSIHLEWSEDQLDRIVERMDNIYSRNISDGFGTNFSQAKIQRGE